MPPQCLYCLDAAFVVACTGFAPDNQIISNLATPEEDCRCVACSQKPCPLKGGCSRVACMEMLGR